jgi:hypothetical protein
MMDGEDIMGLLLISATNDSMLAIASRMSFR